MYVGLTLQVAIKQLDLFQELAVGALSAVGFAECAHVPVGAEHWLLHLIDQNLDRLQNAAALLRVHSTKEDDLRVRISYFKLSRLTAVADSVGGSCQIS